MFESGVTPSRARGRDDPSMVAMENVVWRGVLDVFLAGGDFQPFIARVSSGFQAIMALEAPPAIIQPPSFNPQSRFEDITETETSSKERTPDVDKLINREAELARRERELLEKEAVIVEKERQREDLAAQEAARIASAQRAAEEETERAALARAQAIESAALAAEARATAMAEAEHTRREAEEAALREQHQNRLAELDRVLREKEAALEEADNVLQYKRMESLRLSEQPESRIPALDPSHDEKVKAAAYREVMSKFRQSRASTLAPVSEEASDHPMPPVPPQSDNTADTISADSVIAFLSRWTQDRFIPPDASGKAAPPSAPQTSPQGSSFAGGISFSSPKPTNVASTSGSPKHTVSPVPEVPKSHTSGTVFGAVGMVPAPPTSTTPVPPPQPPLVEELNPSGTHEKVDETPRMQWGLYSFLLQNFSYAEHPV